MSTLFALWDHSDEFIFPGISMFNFSSAALEELIIDFFFKFKIVAEPLYEILSNYLKLDKFCLDNRPRPVVGAIW